jgi:hypothetical protein
MQMLLCYRPIDPECTCPKKAGVPVTFTCGADARRSEKGSSSFRGVVLGELVERVGNITNKEWFN